MRQIIFNAGSDIRLNLEYRDDNGPIEVSQPEAIMVEGIDRSLIDVSLAPGEVGSVRVFIEGTDFLTVGRIVFRVRVTKTDGDTLASPRIVVDVQ